MTQDQPKQPEPEKQTPPTPTPTPTPAALQSGKAVVAIVQTLVETWKAVQPVLKAGTVNTLRGTIWVLQGAVDKLEPQPKLEIQLVSDTLSSAATLPLETAGSTLPSAAAVTVEVTTTPVAPKPTAQVQAVQQKPSVWAIARNIIVTIWQLWKGAVGKIRSLLPLSVKQKLPNDSILSGAIAAVAIFVLWANSAISSGKPPAVVKIPPATPSVPVQIKTPEEIKVSPEVTPVPEINVTPTVTPTVEIKVSPELTPAVEIKVSPEVTSVPEIKVIPATQGEITAPAIETPPEITAPKPPKPVAIVPPPAPVLTPEQKLIAEIQNKIAEITKQSAEGLIQSIEANFQTSQLTVKISDDWYNFDVAKQDKLVADIWSRARELDFSKVEITDTKATLIARNAIVGSNIVVLKRQL